jgi:hypothetical protein
VERRARVARRVVWVALVPIMIGSVRLAPELIAPRHHPAAGAPTIENRASSGNLLPSSTEPLPPRSFSPAREREDDNDIDLYGNDVSDAVAKYKLDSDGSLYELHSPQTQLPRLGSPRT